MAQAAGQLFGLAVSNAFRDGSWSRFGVRLARLENDIRDPQEFMRHGNNSPLGSPARLDAVVRGAELGVLLPGRTPGKSTRVARRNGLPFRVLPLNRLPALSLLPGQIPVHEARWSGSSKTVMSGPVAALGSARPGMVYSKAYA